MAMYDLTHHHNVLAANDKQPKSLFCPFQLQIVALDRIFQQQITLNIIEAETTYHKVYTELVIRSKDSVKLTPISQNNQQALYHIFIEYSQYT